MPDTGSDPNIEKIAHLMTIALFVGAPTVLIVFIGAMVLRGFGII